MQHTLPTTFPASLRPDPQLPAVRKRMRDGAACAASMIGSVGLAERNISNLTPLAWPT